MSRGGEVPENQRLRVSIRRALPECPMDSEAAKEVAFNRGGVTAADLFEFGMWWADQWAMSEPGTTFFAVAQWVGPLPYRTLMPSDFPAVPLPSSAVEFDRAFRERIELTAVRPRGARRLSAADGEAGDLASSRSDRP